MNNFAEICILLASWIAYGAMHSAMASFRLKNWIAAHLPAIMPYYRILFNFISIAGLIPILYISLTIPTIYLWKWGGGLQWIATITGFAAAAGIVWSFRYYDITEFVGTRQINNKSMTPDIGMFRLSPMHRFVRHPWYALALLIIWTRDMDLLLLTSSIMATVYFVIGSRLEEKKLLALYGEIYDRYCIKVPALFPLPWRFLRTSEAQALMLGMTINVSGKEIAKQGEGFS